MRYTNTVGIVSIVICVALLLLWYSGAYNYITLSSLHVYKVTLENYVTAHYGKAVVLYMCVYMVTIALAIPGLPLLTMLGGFLFGFMYGALYAIISATVGSSLSFLVIRYLLSSLIRGKYAQRLETFNEKIASYGIASYLLTLQCIGLIPYFVINTLAALAHVPFITFVWTTFVGSLPIIGIYSFAGRKLYVIESIKEIFSPSMIGLLVLFSVMASIPLLLRFSRRVIDLR